MATVMSVNVPSTDEAPPVNGSQRFTELWQRITGQSFNWQVTMKRLDSTVDPLFDTHPHGNLLSSTLGFV
ncbi:hypothetical protein ColTof3_14574 [Colletotrichum tofieldiae]|nr:hypothetical protein ColTof3_14574 [Colletotrichum tofieldiae]